MQRFRKPRYIDPVASSLGTLSFSPPFLFKNVTVRLFPLKANMGALTTFCNNYLNMDIDPEIVHYTPALPYVYLSVINYGSMSSDSVQAQNIGWVSQHEVTFEVPLQRWRKIDDRLVFQDWATVCPFIYVDDPSSLATGREVYGWNKVSCTIDADIPLWVSDPRARVREFGMSIDDIGTTNRGNQSQNQTLLRIDTDPPPAMVQFPPEPFDPWSPLWAIPTGIGNAASLAGNALDIALSLRIRGYESHRTIESLVEMAKVASRKLGSVMNSLQPSHGQDPSTLDAAIRGLPNLFTDSVTLKQFRNPRQTDLACYQALVSSMMGVNRLNRAGLLGDVNLLRGDTSGGYRVAITEMDSQPIIQTLGIEVSTPSSAGGVSYIRPVLPMWMDLDLYYGKGKVICSRTQSYDGDAASAWRDEQDDTPLVPVDSRPAKKPPPPSYNATLGQATQPITGPFHYPDVTVQVYPLLAERATLEIFLHDYLNGPLTHMTDTADGRPILRDGVPKGWRFELCGSYVYMAVTVFGQKLGEAWSATNNIGDFFDKEVTFGIPVKWFDQDDNLVTMALVTPFVFSNNGRGVTTSREVNGFNAIRATIDSLADPWMEAGGPIARPRYVRMMTEVIPALNVGQKSQQRPLLEIDARDALPDDDATGWQRVVDDWWPPVIGDLKRKTYLAAQDAYFVDAVKALSLEFLVNGKAINRLAIKEYRDSWELDRACYQAIVIVANTITAIYDMREIEDPVFVRLYRWPTVPIADLLGLKIESQRSVDGNVIDTIQPLRPFWMRLALKEDLGTVACCRTTDAPWRIVHPWLDCQGSPGRPPADNFYFRRTGYTAVGPWLGQGKDKGGAALRLGLKSQAAQWLRGAVTNQLAWIRVSYQWAWTSEDKTAFLAYLDALAPAKGLRASFDELLSAASVERFCDSRKVKDLVSLVDGLTGCVGGAGLRLTEPRETRWPPVADSTFHGDGSDPMQGPSSPAVIAFIDDFNELFKWFTDLIQRTGTALSEDERSVVVAALMNEAQVSATMNRNLETLNCMRRLEQEVFVLMFPDGARQTLANLAAFKIFDFKAHPDIGIVELAKHQNELGDALSQTGLLSQIIDKCMTGWTKPYHWRQLNYDEAAGCVGALDEMQLVVDDILSKGWENQAPGPTWVDVYGLDKPAEFLPDGPHFAASAEEFGLAPWGGSHSPASGLWVVPPPPRVLGA